MQEELNMSVVSKRLRKLHVHGLRASVVPGALALMAFAGSARADSSRIFDNAMLVVDGKCLDVRGGVTDNQTPVQIFDCHGGANQRWTMHVDGVIHSALDWNKCLDLPGWNTADHTRIQIYDCNGGTNQSWSYEWDNTIRGFGGKCLDLPFGNTTNGTLMQYYECHGHINQQFFALP